MPRGPNGENRPAGMAECAHKDFQVAIGADVDEGPLGRRASGLAGTKARTKSLTELERSAIAKNAAIVRWDREKERKRNT